MDSEMCGLMEQPCDIFLLDNTGTLYGLIIKELAAQAFYMNIAIYYIYKR